MNILHIVSTRFLYKDFFNDGRIFNKDYQEEAKDILLNSFIHTLENQNDKDFECVILTHADCKKFVKKIKFPFQVSILTKDEVIAYIKSNLKNYDYIIHTTSDYDDFFHKDCLSLIKKINKR